MTNPVARKFGRMSGNSVSFVEWKEEFVSQERGSRIVHYILKDSSGESILAVVGTERSLRHMVYVVADDFVNAYSGENSIPSGFKWRSRREVIDWLTSMLSKQHLQDVAKCDSPQGIGPSELFLTRSSADRFVGGVKMGDCTRNSKQPSTDVLWLGASWTCGKQLKHYPAFCRNGITIPMQSFVFIMAKEMSRYLAYLEDMYEDKKCQKKVKVRWFHHCQEVKGVTGLRNYHPKEVFITPHTQVISVECVDGPAIVLNREHFEQCMDGFSGVLPAKLHLCIRQYKKNRVRPFDLSKLRGYFDQPIFSCLKSNNFVDPDPGRIDKARNETKLFSAGENVILGAKRTRNSGDERSLLTVHSGAGRHRKKIMLESLFLNKYDLSGRGSPILKNARCKHWNSQLLKVNEKIELLSQDSGIRGCWFRCTIVELSRKQIKVQYNDVEDQDCGGNLEEWVPGFRLAALDKFGIRWPRRPTIRPCPPPTKLPDTFEIGAPVDAWWCDGWWEGIVAGLSSNGDDNLQVYMPGENLLLNVARMNLRVSREWAGGQWVDIKAKPDILSAISISTETKLSRTPIQGEEQKSDDFEASNKEIPPHSKVDSIESRDDIVVSLDATLVPSENKIGGVGDADADDIEKNDEMDIHQNDDDIMKSKDVEPMEITR